MAKEYNSKSMYNPYVRLHWRVYVNVLIHMYSKHFNEIFYNLWTHKMKSEDFSILNRALRAYYQEFSDVIDYCLNQGQLQH